MKVQQFLEHHGIARNPFAEEDAQTDPVFKDHCIDTTYHPAWDKVYGDPREPSTSLVFGEKGSGKTAMRLQIVRHLRRFNQEHPQQRLYIVQYDDFNPFLDRYRSRLSKRRQRPDRMLSNWKLWDHMDAILSLAVTGLVDRIVDNPRPQESVNGKVSEEDVRRLDRNQSRDVLLLAAFYDYSTAETFQGRWVRLRRALRFSTWRSKLWWVVAIAWTLVVVAGFISLATRSADYLAPMWLSVAAGVTALGWLPLVSRQLWRWWKSRVICHRLRVGNRQRGDLRRALATFTADELSGQPMPSKDSTDDRYELLLKLQSVLRTLGFEGIIVLVDRVDEPYLINGAADLMKALLWPMLDNKFLKHPGLGLKMMLPIELTRYIEKEDQSFYQRSRLDKQNVIPSFEWTGQALLDVTNARLLACAVPGSQPKFRGMFDESVSEHRLLEALASLRVPRHLFKFMYRLLITHCNNYTADAPQWRIPAQTFEATLALYARDKDAFERGVGAG